MKTIYLAVAGRIRRQLQELEQVVERAYCIWQRGIAQTDEGKDDYYVDATALNLHGFYAGIERLLEVIIEFHPTAVRFSPAFAGSHLQNF